MKKILSFLMILIFVFSLSITTLYAEGMVDDGAVSIVIPKPDDPVVSDEDIVISSNGKLPFEDIKAGAWYIDGLAFCYVNGIISGAGNTYTFAPKAEMTRATFAVMLARATNTDVTAYKSFRSFSDCKYPSWYSAEVEWCNAIGYMTGAGDGKFRPDATITRQEIATVFMRYMLGAEYAVVVPDGILEGYTDEKDISAWAKGGVGYAVAAGLLSSTSTSELVFSPKMPVTRNQAVKLFKSFLTGYFYGNCDHKFTSPTCTDSSYCEVCSMINSLPLGHFCKDLSCKNGGICVTCGESVDPDGGLHVYSPATCELPETCEVCSGTRAPAIGHKFKAATCTTAKKCTRCKGTFGEPLGHKYKAATCTEAKICSRCGGKSGNPLGHSFSVATCIKPQTCSRCQATKGNKAPHSYASGVCKICRDCPFDTLAKKLIADDGLYSTVEGETYSYAVYAMYDEETNELYFTLFHTYSNGDSDALQIDVNRAGSESDFIYEYYNKNDETIFYGCGVFKPSSFSASASISFTEYQGQSSDAVTAIANVKGLGDLLLDSCADMILDAYGIDFTVLGFSNY